MIEEYAHVKIKATDIPGIVVDAYSIHGKTWYTVEYDERDEDGTFHLDTYDEDELEVTGPPSW